MILYPLFLGEPFPTPSKPFSASADLFLLHGRFGCYGKKTACTRKLGSVPEPPQNEKKKEPLCPKGVRTRLS